MKVYEIVLALVIFLIVGWIGTMDREDEELTSLLSAEMYPRVAAHR